MSQRTGGIRRPLAHARLYSAVQQALGAERVRATFVQEHLRPQPGERVLDLGSGPGDILALLPQVEYVGLDASPAYVAAGQAREDGRASFVRADVRDPSGWPPGPFDAAISIGVLHHLDDAGAKAMLAGAARALSPDGRLLTLDPAHAPGQPRLARWLIERDRGQAVRTVPEYEELGRGIFDEIRGEVRHGLARVPYTHGFVEFRRPRSGGPRCGAV